MSEETALAEFIDRPQTESPPLEPGALSLHDQLGSSSMTGSLVITPTTLPSADRCPKDQKDCTRWKIRKHIHQGFMTGRAKDNFVCHECNGVDSRIGRLTMGLLISKVWRDQTPEQKQAWRQEYGHLRDAALKEQLTASMTQSTLYEDSVRKGSLGQYLPLSVYRAKGYSEDAKVNLVVVACIPTCAVVPISRGTESFHTG